MSNFALPLRNKKGYKGKLKGIEGQMIPTPGRGRLKARGIFFQIFRTPPELVGPTQPTPLRILAYTDFYRY